MVSEDKTTAPDLYLMRAEGIMGFETLLRRESVDPEPLYREVGLSPLAFADPENKLPYISIVKLVDLASKKTGLEDFGLQLADIQAAFPIGPLGLLLQQGPSIQAALENLVNYYHLHSEGVAWSLKFDHKYAYLLREDFLANQVSTFHNASMHMAHALRSMKIMCNDPGWKPSFVNFTHSAPANPRPWQEYFHHTVQFGQESSCFIFPAQDLKRELLYTNERLQALLEVKVAELEQASAGRTGFIAKVEVLIRQNLRTGNCSQEYIASQFLLHPKKFQRLLRSEGISFRELKARVRLDVAEHFIKESSLPLTVIAQMLDYSELCVLSRTFKARHDVSPMDWRQQT